MADRTSFVSLIHSNFLIFPFLTGQDSLSSLISAPGHVPGPRVVGNRGSPHTPPEVPNTDRQDVYKKILEGRQCQVLSPDLTDVKEGIEQ